MGLYYGSWISRMIVLWGAEMGYVRYKLPDQTHQMLKKVCMRLGMKESEISRISVMEYLKSIGVLSENVRKVSFVEKLEIIKKEREVRKEKTGRRHLLSRLRKRDE